MACTASLLHVHTETGTTAAMALSYQPLQPGGATKSKSRAVVLGMLAVVLACCAAVALLRGAPAFVVGSSKVQELTQMEFEGYGYTDMDKHRLKEGDGRRRERPEEDQCVPR